MRLAALNEVPVYGRKNQFYGRINPRRPIREHADGRQPNVERLKASIHTEKKSLVYLNIVFFLLARR